MLIPYALKENYKYTWSGIYIKCPGTKCSGRGICWESLRICERWWAQAWLRWWQSPCGSLVAEDRFQSLQHVCHTRKAALMRNRYQGDITCWKMSLPRFRGQIHPTVPLLGGWFMAEHRTYLDTQTHERSSLVVWYGSSSAFSSPSLVTRRTVPRSRSGIPRMQSLDASMGLSQLNRFQNQCSTLEGMQPRRAGVVLLGAGLCIAAQALPTTLPPRYVVQGLAKDFSELRPNDAGLPACLRRHRPTLVWWRNREWDWLGKEWRLAICQLVVRRELQR